MATVTQPVQGRTASRAKRKPLGVRVTPEQHSMLREAASREHRSVSSFVLQAALQAAEAVRPKKRSIDEVRAILKAAQEEVAAKAPKDRSFLEELTGERRRLAAHE